MATQYEPIVKDSTLNTTEQNPRNLADVLASGLANIANNVKPDGSDISIDVPGMSANNVDDGFSELKQSLDDKTDYSTFVPTGATSIADAIGIVWDSIRTDKTVIGNFNYQGQIMFMAFKYKAGNAYYGMMLAMRYEAANIYVLNVINNSKGVKTLTIN